MICAQNLKILSKRITKAVESHPINFLIFWKFLPLWNEAPHFWKICQFSYNAGQFLSICGNFLLPIASNSFTILQFDPKIRNHRITHILPVFSKIMVFSLNDHGFKICKLQKKLIFQQIVAKTENFPDNKLSKAI